MREALTLLVLWTVLAAPAAAQQVGELRRGPLRAVVRVRGTVSAEELLRLNAPIDGRVEEILVSSGTWVEPKTDLARMLSREMAAMKDSQGSISEQIMQDRWGKTYRPNAVNCPVRCYVTRVFARPKTVVPSGTALVEAARKLRLLGHVRPGDMAFVRKGQLIDFWDPRRPSRRLQARVEDVRFDVAGQKVAPGGSVTALLEYGYALEPGTSWEGEIVTQERADALRVPTGALIRFGDELFLPVRVSTGITTYEATEITGGASDRQRFLILDPSKIGDAKAYEPAPTKPRSRRAAPRAERRPDEDAEPEASSGGPESGNADIVESGNDYPSDYDHE
ncbi:MAG: efflux RND transporter periplasmic adaptor subunit [Elusimicrobiota bacterium]